MCARFQSPLNSDRLNELFGSVPIFNFEFNPNLAPTERTPIFTSENGKPDWKHARFGLVPFWSKTLKGVPSLHNARGETVSEKPAFKKAYSTKRCIIPAEGFYEWREENGKKQPYLFTRKDGGLITFAGIWNRAEIENEKIISFSIVTGEPFEKFIQYHDRMPLIIDDFSSWLDIKQDVATTIKRVPSDAFNVRAVNPVVNKSSFKHYAEIMKAPAKTNVTGSLF